MKPTAALLLCLAWLPACTSVKGTGWSYNSFGGDAKGIHVSADRFEVTELKQSAALKNVTETIRGMWTNYLLAKGIEYMADKYYAHEGKIVSSAETVKLEELKNAKSVADAEAALKAAEAAHAAEAAATTIPLP